MFLKIAKELYRLYGTTCILVVQHRQRVRDVEKYSLIVNDLLSYLDDAVFAVGVGSLCVNRSPSKVFEFIEEVMKRVNTRVHGFGTHLRVIYYLTIYSSYMHRFSFDSTSWTRPVNDYVRRVIKAQKRFSCKDDRQRTVYFMCYVARLCELLNFVSTAGELYNLAIEYYWRKIENRRVSLIHEETRNILSFIAPKH